MPNNKLLASLLLVLLLSTTSAHGMEVKQLAATNAEEINTPVHFRAQRAFLTQEHEDIAGFSGLPANIAHLIGQHFSSDWDCSYPTKAWLERSLCFDMPNMRLQTAIQLSDGRIAIGTETGDIYLLDIAHKTQIHFEADLKNNNVYPRDRDHQRTEIRTLVELPNDRLFLKSHSNTCEIWDIATNSPQLITRWQWYDCNREQVVALPNDIFATSSRISLKLYSTQTKTETASARRDEVDEFGPYTRGLDITSLIQLSDTLLASGEYEHNRLTSGLTLWELRTENSVTIPVEISHIDHHNQAGNRQHIAFLKKISDTIMISTAGDDGTKECALRLWDISNPRNPIELSKIIIMSTKAGYIGHYISDIITVAPTIIAALSVQNEKIYFYDITDPSMPRELCILPFDNRLEIVPYKTDQFIGIEGSKVFLYKPNQEAIAAITHLRENKKTELIALIETLNRLNVKRINRRFLDQYEQRANIITLTQNQLNQFNALPEAIKQTLQSHYPISSISIEAQQEVARKAQIARLPFMQRKWAEFKELPTKQKLMVIGGIILAGAYAYSKFKKRSPKTPSAVNAWRFLRSRAK